MRQIGTLSKVDGMVKLLIMGHYWDHVRARAGDTEFTSLSRLGSRTRTVNEYIHTILHCDVPDFKYARFLWKENPLRILSNAKQRVKINYTG